MPIGLSVYLKETYENMNMLQMKIKLKVLSMLLGNKGAIPNNHDAFGV